MKRLIESFKKKYLDGCELVVGDVVKDIGDSFQSIKDAGVVIEVLPERYTYRNAFGIKVKYDGILIRWMDSKGTTHVYPCCCVKKLELSPEAAEDLRKSAEEKYKKPLEEELKVFEDIFSEVTEEVEQDSSTEEVEPEAKPPLNKLQEQLREIERIVAERNAAAAEDSDEDGEE